jgi:hypothetical protein
MPSMILVPHMKDYDSKVDTLAAWQAGKDFLIKNFYHAYHGKPMSIRNIDTLIAEGFTHVELRYHKMTRCIFIDIRKELK